MAHVTLAGDISGDYLVDEHPSARLSAREKQDLIRGLRATFGAGA